MSFELPFQTQLREQVLLALEETSNGSNSVGILLIGDSGTGKTHGLDIIAGLREPYRDGDQLCIPCFRIDARTASEHRAIAKRGREQLRAPIPKSSRENPETELIRAMRARKTELAILEEFHDALTREARQLRGKTEALLKGLWNFNDEESVSSWAGDRPGNESRKPVIIVSGTEVLLDVFRAGTELGSRFSTVVRADRLTMFPPEAFRAYRLILAEMAARYGLQDIVDPDDSRFAARTYFGTGAHLRDLDNLFKRVATLRGRDGSIPLQELLEMASKLLVPKDVTNPFLQDAEDIDKRVSQEYERYKRRGGKL